jgi:hypothetical protein
MVLGDDDPAAPDTQAVIDVFNSNASAGREEIYEVVH